MSKHAPGPWVARGIQVWRGKKRVVSCVNAGCDEPMSLPCAFDRSLANARLIAAAPDLLSALQDVLRVADRKTDEFDAARAAIAKAVGDV